MNKKTILLVIFIILFLILGINLNKKENDLENLKIKWENLLKEVKIYGKVNEVIRLEEKTYTHRSTIYLLDKNGKYSFIEEKKEDNDEIADNTDKSDMLFVNQEANEAYIYDEGKWQLLDETINGVSPIILFTRIDDSLLEIQSVAKIGNDFHCKYKKNPKILTYMSEMENNSIISGKVVFGCNDQGNIVSILQVLRLKDKITGEMKIQEIFLEIEDYSRKEIEKIINQYKDNLL